VEHKSKYFENQTISVTIDFWWHWHFSKYLLSCSIEHHTGLDQHEILGFYIQFSVTHFEFETAAWCDAISGNQRISDDLWITIL